MKIRVFVFEDDSLVRDTVVSIVDSLGYKVYSYADPGEVGKNLKVASSDDHLDVVITDIQMPKMTGIEFVRRLVDSGFKAENIAVMSGAWGEENLRYAEKIGVLVLQKPVAVFQLLSWFEKCRCRAKGNCIVMDISENDDSVD